MGDLDTDPDRLLVVGASGFLVDSRVFRRPSRVVVAAVTDDEDALGKEEVGARNKEQNGNRNEKLVYGHNRSLAGVVGVLCCGDGACARLTGCAAWRYDGRDIGRGLD